MDPLSSLIDDLQPRSSDIVAINPAENAVDVTAPQSGVCLNVVLAGASEVLFDEGRSTRLCTTGAGLLLPPDHRITVRASSARVPTRLLMVAYQIQQSHLEMLQEAVPAPRVLAARLSDGGWQQHAWALNEELTRDAPGQQIAREALSTLLLLAVIRDELWPAGALQDIVASRSDTYVRRAIHALRKQPSRTWSTHMLANEIGLSRSALSQRFQKSLGCTPMRYLLQHRIRLVDRLLKDKQRPLRDVAHAVGYGSVSSLRQAYLRCTGGPLTEPESGHQSHRLLTK